MCNFSKHYNRSFFPPSMWQFTSISRPISRFYLLNENIDFPNPTLITLTMDDIKILPFYFANFILIYYFNSENKNLMSRHSMQSIFPIHVRTIRIYTWYFVFLCYFSFFVFFPLCCTWICCYRIWVDVFK